MAIDYSQYARSYAGSPGGYAQLGQGIGSALGNLVKKRKEEELATVSQSYQDALTGDLMGGDLYKMMSTSAKDWGKMSGTVMPNAFEAYNAFKASVEGTPQEKIARRQGLLNPITFKQQHDAYMGMIAPSIANKIITYQAEGNKSNSQMREWIEEKGLNSFVSSNFRDSMDPAHMQLQSWALPKVGLKQQALNLGRGLTEDWTLGGAAGVGTAVLTSPVWAPAAMKGITAVGSKIPGIAGAGAKYTKAAMKAIPYAANKTVGQVARGITGAAGGSEKQKALAQEGAELGMNAVLFALQKHGLPKIMRTVTKKLGAKTAMKTLGKLGLGALGSVGTYGLGTAAMAAWTAKDLYDIYNIIKTMK